MIDENALGNTKEEVIIPHKVDRSKWNKSVYFILPMIGLNSNYPNLINSYLGDIVNKPEYNYEKIFVHLKYRDDKNIINRPYYNSFYRDQDIDGNISYIYIFDIPDHFNLDYKLFCDGAYSRFSKRYKDQILSLIRTRPIQNSPTYKVLYKTLDLKKIIEDMIGEDLPMDAEVCSITNLSREIRSTEERDI